MQRIILAVLLVACAAAAEAPPQPGMLEPKALARLLKLRTKLKYVHVAPIGLLDGSRAFLVEAELPDLCSSDRNPRKVYPVRGDDDTICSMASAADRPLILYVPAAKRAHILDEGQSFKVDDLDGDGVSEIITDFNTYTQGTAFYETSILQVSGSGKPSVLWTSGRFSDDSEACEAYGDDDTTCPDITDVGLELKDVDADGWKDVCITETKELGKKMKKKTSASKCLRFTGKALVALPEKL